MAVLGVGPRQAIDIANKSDNQRIQRNAEAIWELIKDDPRYCCHGRAVSLAEGFEENIQLQASLLYR